MDDVVDGDSESSSHCDEHGELDVDTSELSNSRAGFPGDDEAVDMDIDVDNGVSSFEKDECAMIGDAVDANEMDAWSTAPRCIGFDTTQTSLLCEFSELFGQLCSYTCGTQRSSLAYSDIVDLMFVFWGVETDGIASPTLSGTTHSFVLLVGVHKCLVCRSPRWLVIHTG